MLHSGLDLHKRTLVITTVNDAGDLVADVSLPTTRVAVRSYFARHPGPHRAVVESTSNWYWLRDLLATTEGCADPGALQVCEGDQLREGEDRCRRCGHTRSLAAE
jgi:hypothetical protein